MILAWVNDIVEAVVSLVTGMRTTGRFWSENWRGAGGAAAVTRRYPEEPAVAVGERTRGHLINDASRCIVCRACEKACPVDCIIMDGERTEDNKLRASRFDIDLAKCLSCGLCVRVCPTDSLAMTASFAVEPVGPLGPFLFRRRSDQLDHRLAGTDMERLRTLSARPRHTLSPEDRAWLDQVTDPQGPHLIGLYGFGYYDSAEKARVEAERERRKQAKEAAAKAAAAAKAEAAAKAAAQELASKPADPGTAP